MTTFPKFWDWGQKNGQNWVILAYFGRQNDIICKKFLKIIPVRFLDINLVKIVINGVNLVKIGNLCEIVPNSIIFGGKNEVICQNFGKVVKNFFTKKIEKSFQGSTCIWMNLTKKSLKGSKWTKYAFFVFSYIY